MNDEVKDFKKKPFIWFQGTVTGVYDMFPHYCQIGTGKHIIFDEKETTGIIRHISKH
jgi:hypothetical protein